MRTRVVYWNNIPAPYMVDRFNALALRGNLDFEAWFSARSKKGRQWVVDERSWEFQHRYLPSIDRGTYPFAIPTPLLGREAPDVLVSLYAAPAFLLGSAVARSRGARTAFWVERTFETWVTRRRWKERMKSNIFPRADAIITPGADGRDFALRYGAREGRVFIVPHVVDVARYARGSALHEAERRRIRDEYGLKGVTFAYVGRFLSGKGLEYLVEAFSRLQRESGERMTLLLVGAGDDEDALRARCVDGDVSNVVFAGYHDSDSLPALYAAADVFVFPTLGDTFGLVVSEAMACGLPVVATTACGEIEGRVSEGVNGFLVPPADSKALLERMSLLARDPELRRRMGEASREKVAGQTPHLWAEAFEQAIGTIVETPRVRDSRPRRRDRARSAVGDRLS